MNRDDSPVREQSGPIAYMARNSVAANLLMLFLVVAGLAAARDLIQEVLPDFSLDRVQILVPYPGAAPEEVEESIVRKIEEQIRGVDGLKRVEATASEGLASVIAEFKTNTDINRALNDIKAEVDRIPTFPAGAERPEVREVTSRQSVIRLLVYGEVPEHTLKELAYGIEEGISSLPEVSLAETSGARQYEISIEVPLHRLRALGLTLDDVAFAVRQGSLELSAGKISTDEEEILVRTLGQNYDQADFEDIIVLTRPDGTSVRLGDIATVRDGFADTDLIVRYNGQRAVRVDVYRTSEEQVLEIAEVVKDYLAAEVQPTLPEGVSVEIWKDDSEEVGGRLGLMIKSALIGMILVFLMLTLFLEIGLAVWVAAGVGVSFMGTFLVMGFLGVSINMFSLMALVLALGIVVDDAIVVGESVFAFRARAPGATRSRHSHRGDHGTVALADRVPVCVTKPPFAPASAGRAWRYLAQPAHPRHSESRGCSAQANRGRPPGPWTATGRRPPPYHSCLCRGPDVTIDGGRGIGYRPKPVSHSYRGPGRLCQSGDARGHTGGADDCDRCRTRSCGTPRGGPDRGGPGRGRTSAGGWAWLSPWGKR